MMKKVLVLFQLFWLFCMSTGCGKSSADAHEFEKRAVDKGFHIVGYMFSSGNLDTESAKLDFGKITHLNIAFINPDETGVFAPLIGLSEAVKRAHDHGVKVFSSFGGGNSPAHLKELLKPENRQVLVTSLVNLATTFDLDGIDVDLEGDFIDENYEAFIVELHAELKKHQKSITAAVATWNGAAISDKALALFDLVHIMSYDHTGPWNKERPGPHATYEAAVSDFTYWNTDRSVPAHKLTLGLPFYGYGFGPDITESMSFMDIVNTYPGAENVDQVDIPGSGTIYYNGLATMEKKVTLALDKAAGGVMIWQLLGDAAGEKSLLTAINNTIP